MLWWKLQRLKSKDSKTRIRMVEEMAASGKASVLEPITEALKEDEDSEVRAAAAKALGTLRDERSLAPLTAALNDPKPDVRAAVVQALRQLGDQRAIDPLLNSLRDPNHHVRFHVANSLSALGWRPNTDTEFVLRSVALGQHEEAAAYGKESVQLLIKALEDITSPKRQAAAVALGKTGDQRAIKPLEAALEDNDNHVRVAAVEALSQIGASECSAALFRRLQDSDHHVRAAAVEALGRMGDPRIVDPIAKSLLNDSSWDVRKLSVEALGRIKDDRATQLLWQALTDKDHDVRQTAAAALGHIPEPRSIGPLVLALKDENSSVRQAAKASLRQIDRQWEVSPGAESVIPELEAAVNNKEYWVAQSAADTLAKINDMRQRSLETSFIIDPAKQKRDLAITLLADTLRDLDRDVRQAAAEALGRIVDDRVVSPLVSALDDQDQWVGRAAAFALNHLNWAPAPDDKRRADKLKSLLHQS
ncbi:MAG: lyase domain protein repeat-containing protein [Pedosphaera sp.]|nr:lyase domain protein repeat-containing protein [Pedosphaera sp.]